MSQNKILLIGLGNSILSDDAAGIEVARTVAGKLKDGAVEFVEASYAGWRLIDILNGYKRAIIVDSIVGERYKPGECYKVELKNMKLLHLSSSHGMGLNEAIGMAKMQGFQIPEKISLYAIGVSNPFEFGEKMTDEVSGGIQGAAEKIIKEENLDA